MKPRKKLIEEAKADGTLDKCDRLTCANLLLEISRKLFLKAGEELKRRNLFLPRDLGQFRKNSPDGTFPGTRRYSYYNGHIGSKDWSGEIDTYTEKIIKLLNLEKDFK